MKSFWRFLIAFLAVTGAVALMTGVFGMKLGHSNYWDHHGVFFLIFLMAFPRLTLLFSSVPSGGLVWWLGWLFAPRILVAMLATLAYWHQNPILVVISWLVALGGESSEKYIIVRRRWNGRGLQERNGSQHWGDSRGGEGQGFESAKWVDAEVERGR